MNSSRISDTENINAGEGTLSAPTSVPAARDEWKEAVIDACVCGHLSWDENDPRKTLAALIAWECKIALDPQVSKEAADLVAGGAAAREKMTARVYWHKWIEAVGGHKYGLDNDELESPVAVEFAEAYAKLPGGKVDEQQGIIKNNDLTA